VAWLNLDPARYRTPEARSAHYERVFEELRRLEGVRAVSGIDLPFQFDWQQETITDDTGQNAWTVLARAATPEYFADVGIPVLAGRPLLSTDVAGTQPVALVSSALAERLWPDASPIGRLVRAQAEQAAGPWLTVVGVVGDTRSAPHEPPSAILYRPVSQAPPPWLYLVLRTDRDATSVAADMRRAVWSVDPEQPVDGPTPVVDQVNRATAYLRFLVLLGLVLAATGLMIALTGVHGLIAHLVQSSTREIGLRKALGARTQDITSMLLRRSTSLAIPAGIAGVAIGTAMVRVLRSEVDGLEPLSIWITAGAIAVFVGAAGMATYLPSRRIAAIKVSTALRAE
jgi:hypothetical protein